MKQRLTFLALLTLTTTLHAAEPPAELKKALASIPADASGFVVVPSIEKLDASLQEAVTKFEMQDLVPPGMLSITGLLRQYLGVSEGLDAKGALIVAFIPGQGDAAYPQPMQTAYVLPASDPEALLKGIGGQVGEGGAWSVNMLGTPQQAVTADGKVVLCNTAATAKAVATTTSSISARMKDSDLAAMSEQDLLVWIDGERMVKQFKPQIDGFMAMFMMMQGGSDPNMMKQAQNTQKQLNMLLDGMRSLLIGLSVDAKGMGLRFFLASRPGTEFANRLKNSRTTSDSMLEGLPGGKYMAAGGTVVHPEAMRLAMDDLDPYFDMLGTDESETNKAHIDQLQQLVRELGVLVSGMRMSLTQLPAGGHGLMGLAMLVDVSDSAKFGDLTGKIFAKMMEIDPQDDAGGQELKEALSFENAKETLESAEVSHFKIDLQKFDDVDEEDLEDVMTIIGQEGVLVRLAAIDGKTMAVSLGGGADFMKQLIVGGRAGKAPLAQDAGVKRVASHVPDQRTGVFYVAVDQIIACVREGQKRIDEEQLPVKMPELNAPMLMASRTENTWSLADVYLPAELIVAGKSFIMGMLGEPAQAGSPPPAPAGVSN